MAGLNVDVDDLIPGDRHVSELNLILIERYRPKLKWVPLLKPGPKLGQQQGVNLGLDAGGKLSQLPDVVVHPYGLLPGDVQTETFIGAECQAEKLLLYAAVGQRLDLIPRQRVFFAPGPLDVQPALMERHHPVGAANPSQGQPEQRDQRRGGKGKPRPTPGSRRDRSMTETAVAVAIHAIS